MYIYNIHTTSDSYIDTVKQKNKTSKQRRKQTETSAGYYSQTGSAKWESYYTPFAIDGAISWQICDAVALIYFVLRGTD